MFKDQVLAAMERVFAEAPFGITHTREVLAYAEEIMAGEDVDPAAWEQIAITAILNDIGIPEAQRKFSSSAAPYQEAEGAIIARQLLTDIGYDPDGIERVSYIVGHHHTREAIDGLDFLIIWEADFLVNARGMEEGALQEAISENLQTTTGRQLAMRDLLQ
jgi:HD superfamily phosphodiesterase